MELFNIVLLWGFLIALLMGAVANKTNFCAMGAVSDWINIGDTGRMYAWIFSIAVAILGISILHSFSFIDIGLAVNSETGKPPYLSPQFVWLRFVLGGLLFGIGMTLGSGCGNKTLVRIGGGNGKSIIVFLTMGITSYLMIYTDFGYYLFLQWMTPLAINFLDYGIRDQAVSSIIGSAISEQADLRLIIGIIISALLFAWVFKSDDFRSKFDNVFGGLVIGATVVAVWYVTAGSLGQSLLEEARFLDVRPYDIGAQSFTFVKPSGHFYYLIQQGFTLDVLSLALVIIAGVVLGSFIYAILSRSFHFEWFSTKSDFFRHVISGLIMGIGGVLSLGCTFGQAIAGASTLALSSFITFVFIVIGSAISMKVQYYRMMYEDADFLSALAASLADMHLFPTKWRQLDSL